MKENPANVTVTGDIMVGILISEQNKQRRIEDYNRKQKENKE